LPGAVFVFDECKSHKGITVFPKADPRRNGHLSLIEEKFREIERAHLLACLGDLRPDKHGCLRSLDFPPDAIQPIDQGVSPTTVPFSDFLYTLLRTIEGMDGRYLYGLKNPVIEVALDSGKGLDHFRVTHGKTYSPTRHVVTFGKREKLHPDLSSPGDLKKAWRLISIEGDIGVSKVMDDEETVLLSKLDNPIEKIQVHNFRRRVMRKVDDQKFGLGPALLNGF
jgi:hypothetical protein